MSIYLEYYEDRSFGFLITQEQLTSIEDIEELEMMDDKDFLDNDNSNKRHEDIIFEPSYAYRNPIQNGIEIPCDIDTKTLDRVSLVVLFTTKENDVKVVENNWTVVAVTATRREAIDIKQKISVGDIDLPSGIEDYSNCEVYSLPIED